MEHDRRRRQKQLSTYRNPSQCALAYSFDRATETHPKFPVAISSRTRQDKIALSTKRKQGSRSRLSDEAVEATRTKDRQHKQTTQLHKGLEGYQTFNRIIFNPAEHRCSVCSRLMYEISLTNSRLTAQQLRFLNSSGYSFTIGESIKICSKCLSFIRRFPGKLPPQAHNNSLDPGPIPRCLSELTHMELDFIKRVRPFMKIRKAPTSRPRQN